MIEQHLHLKRWLAIEKMKKNAKQKRKSENSAIVEALKQQRLIELRRRLHKSQRKTARLLIEIGQLEQEEKFRALKEKFLAPHDPIYFRKKPTKHIDTVTGK